MAKRRSKMIHLEHVDNDQRIVAGYARVSTDRQAEEGYSIEVQKEKLTAYVKATQGDDVRLELYVDDGYSGGSIERPALTRLIRDVEANRISKVIVMKLDRLSRSQKDTIYLMEDVFIAHNTGFISINESFDTSTAFGRAIVGILAVFAQLERENIFERTRSGMRKRVEDGYWMGGGRVPFGYDYDPAQGILVPNQDAPIVRKIYELYLSGYSCTHIADMLNLKYDRLVQQILLRKSNAGVIVYNGQEYQGRHEPIIPLETYEAALVMYRSRSQKRSVTKNTHLLTGLMYCGKCGARMKYQIWGSSSKYKIVCYSQQKSKKYMVKDENCSNGRIWAKDVEEIVIKDLFAMTHDAINNFDGSESTASPIDLLTKQKETAETKLSRLYQLYATNGDQVLFKTIEAVKDELQSINQKISDEETAALTARVVHKSYEQIATLEDAWDLMTTAEQHVVVCSVVDSIIITDEHVHINYKI